MTRITKSFLAIAFLGLILGLTTDLFWGLATPIGAVFLGLFLVSKTLESEFALMDKQGGTREH